MMNDSRPHCESDERFVRQAQQGDVRGFSALHDCHYQAVYNYVYFRVSEQAVAEDITAEVFTRMVKRLDRYRRKKKTILPWLYTIARNLVTDHYRKEARTPEQVPIEDLSIPANVKTPEHHIAALMSMDCLKQALKKLTEIQQQVIIGKFIEDRTNEEVAALTKRTTGAIKSLQHRALASLRRYIEQAGCYEPEI